MNEAKQLWVGHGVSFKYSNSFMLMSNKLVGKAGLLTSIEKLDADKEWDLFITLTIKGNLSGKMDGILINLSEQSVYGNIVFYSPDFKMNFGFPYKIQGLYLLITADSEPQKISIQSDVVSETKEIRKGRNIHNFRKEPFRKNGISLKEGTEKLILYLKYKEGNLKLYYKDSMKGKPIILTTYSKTKLNEFYLSMSASVQRNPVQISVSSVYIKSDKENKNLKFFETTKSKFLPDIFKYIHLMYDIHMEHESREGSEDIDISNLRNEEILQRIKDKQMKSLNHLRPSEHIFDSSMSEVNLIFNYLDQHTEATKNYFFKIMKEVNTMLKTAKKEFKFIDSDVKAIVKSFKRNKLKVKIRKAHTKLQKLLNRLASLEYSMTETAKQASEIQDNLHVGHSFLDTYEQILSKLPEDVKTQLEDSTSNGISSINSLMKVVYILMILAVILGFGFILKYLNETSKKQVLM